VRLRENTVASAAELSAFAREHLAAYKTPRSWVFVESFPLTGSGKVQKFVLREQYVKGDLTGT
jgi:fatty-acyl-CoA synthase